MPHTRPQSSASAGTQSLHGQVASSATSSFFRGQKPKYHQLQHRMPSRERLEAHVSPGDKCGQKHALFVVNSD